MAVERSPEFGFQVIKRGNEWFVNVLRDRMPYENLGPYKEPIDAEALYRQMLIYLKLIQ